MAIKSNNWGTSCLRVKHWMRSQRTLPFMSQALVGEDRAGHMKPRLPKLMIAGVNIIMFFSLRTRNGIEYYARQDQAANTLIKVISGIFLDAMLGVKKLKSIVFATTTYITSASNPSHALYRGTRSLPPSHANWRVTSSSCASERVWSL